MKRLVATLSVSLLALGLVATAAHATGPYATGGGATAGEGFEFLANWANGGSKLRSQMVLKLADGRVSAKVTCLNVSGSNAVLVGTVRKDTSPSFAGSTLRFVVDDLSPSSANLDQFYWDTSTYCADDAQTSSAVIDGNVTVGS
jgi:hypothetical protein